MDPSETAPSSSPPPTSTLGPPEQVSHVPYGRRRNTREQIEVLQKVYAITAHPSRGQRQSLASELGMELKSVTNWFQNKRQTCRKKSLAYKENVPSNHRTERPILGSNHISQKAAARSSVSRSTVSLDEVAELSERSTRLRQSVATTPFSLGTSNIQKEVSTPRRSADLWKYMPSSPLTPYSSPHWKEADRSSEAKVFRSLEWACLRARRENRADDDESCAEQRGTVTDDPNLIHEQDTTSVRADRSDCNVGLECVTHSKDVEAAITLLAIKTRA
ncbi:hypothetical protein PISMIDRAFT_671384 [Pisolithus microcarpus 441]|uniref:Homeobox domain-containing protein n=1 Tax=Pisolithus microcarpus 441 TaxID=765257 RepID=A0A0C9ZLC8_9AGAM|nr:hypothetical protein PISMIDRAFT_671384 [Pisolithus microcarpus 441]